jgi:ParB family chromosome partitioning protein
MTKRGLGKGLEALIPMQNQNNDSESNNVTEISIDEIISNPFQPRKDYDEQKLRELAESIKLHGILQPVLLRKQGKKYQLVAGERRWRAAKMADVKKIPAIVKDIDDSSMMEIALIENLQREDLNPIEEALAYKKLMDDFEMTQEKISERVGKSRSQIANTVRLLNLEKEIQKLVETGSISAGHGRALLAIDDKATRAEIVKKIIKECLSVRQTEDLIRKLTKEEKTETRQTKKDDAEKNPFFLQISEVLQRTLGTKVKIKGNEKRGRIEIEYYSPDELDRIFEMIAQ